MQLSSRISVLGKSGGGWDLFVRAKTMVEAGEPIINLTVGDHDIATERAILDAMYRSAVSGKTGYGVATGRLAFRERIASLVEARTGVPTDHDNVVILNGGQTALLAAHLATLTPGDQVAVFDPYYPTYPATISAAAGRCVLIPTLTDDNFDPDLDELERIAPDMRSLLINSPNNPTGNVYAREALERIADTAQRHDLWVVSDEVYWTQVWDGEHCSIRALPDMMERCFVVGSMSKSHAMTGSRVGWLIGPKHAMPAIADLVVATTFGVPEFIQEAALFALDQGTDLEQRIAAPFRARRAIALDILDAQQLVRYAVPKGGMYLMLDIRSTGLSGEQFAERLLSDAQVAVMPGESFGNCAAGHVRIALTCDEEAIGIALTRLLSCAADWASGRS